jgi:hypothetical protein
MTPDCGLAMHKRPKGQRLRATVDSTQAAVAAAPSPPATTRGLQFHTFHIRYSGAAHSRPA